MISTKDIRHTLVLLGTQCTMAFIARESGVHQNTLYRIVSEVAKSCHTRTRDKILSFAADYWLELVTQ